MLKINPQKDLELVNYYLMQDALDNNTDKKKSSLNEKKENHKIVKR